MRERRSNFDVTNQVDLSGAAPVCDAVVDIIRSMYPKADLGSLKQAFEDVHRLFNGEYPTYLPCDTLYHDQQHTLDMTLAICRLINGHDRTVAEEDRIGVERTTLGIITALFHDSGYIRHEQDHHHFNGAEYTLVHVSRSADFLKRYMHKIGLGEQAQNAAQMVHYTGYEVSPSLIRLPDAKTHLVGHMLGTADLIAQMSDRCYLEKCRDRLYPEFVLGGLAVQVDDKGKETVIYGSGEDLLRKTPAFYSHEVENRLNKLFGEVYNYEIAHFDGKRRHYITALGKNQARLKHVLTVDDFSMLRRNPPENYGTRNFPGLEAFFDMHPNQQQRQLR
ncbi:MAG: hypothetical protein WBN96_06445 [Gammaproteobacteria bacterium]